MSSVFLYPQVTDVSRHTELPERAVENNFQNVFDETLQTMSSDRLHFSQHAFERMKNRGIQFDNNTAEKIKSGLRKAWDKGVEDALVLTDQAALIVNARNKTVITVMDLAQLKGNVFTNIDGAVII